MYVKSIVAAAPGYTHYSAAVFARGVGPLAPRSQVLADSGPMRFAGHCQDALDALRGKER